jgi:hypothetical protein
MRRPGLGCAARRSDGASMLRFTLTTLVGAALLFLPAAAHI